MTREVKGGLTTRFNITRTDGKPVPDDRRYIVLDIANDEHAKVAMTAYAESISSMNKEFSEDILEAIKNPELAPKQHSL